MMLGAWAAMLALAVTWLALPAAHAAPRTWTDARTRGLEVAREHRRTLEASLPRRARDLREASASLDRTSTLYARGLVTRQELDAAARDVAASRGQLERAQSDLRRTAMLITELEARPDTLIRHQGARELATGELALLERHVRAHGGGALPVSAMGQTDVHSRLGLDHRHAIDLALHPDSVEGRLVMAWLRERNISFMAFRGARHGVATGAHIHVGRPSGTWAAREAPSRLPTLRGAATPARSAPPATGKGG